MTRLLPALLLLAGCAPSLVSSNEAGGIIGMNGMISGQRKAMIQADAECHKYGKVAVDKGVNEIRNTLRYECVKP